MIDYVKEVNNYGRSLPPIAKQVARDIFTSMLEKGYDYEWLFFAIQNLGQRDIIRHRGLFFYDAFQQEVDAMVAVNRKTEEQRRQHSLKICAAIEQQIQQSKQQNIVSVNLRKEARQYKSAEERLSAIVLMEEE